MKNILIIGGTRFQGPHLIKKILEKKYNLTIFNTGKNLIKENKNIKHIVGDRNNLNDLAQLKNIQFDACIDTCAYLPHHIEYLAKNLKAHHYTLISSIYALDRTCQIITENSPLKKLSSEASVVTPASYGVLKAECERRAHLNFGNKALIIRPGPIIGINDHTRRMAFWMRLIVKHKKNIKISDLDKKLQLIDVEALTNFTVNCVDNDYTDSINVCGNPVTLSEVTNQIIKISNSKYTTLEISIKNLHHQGITNIPYLSDLQDNIYDNSKSISLGLNYPTLNQSIKKIYLEEKFNGFPITKNLDQELKLLESLF